MGKEDPENPLGEGSRGEAGSLGKSSAGQTAPQLLRPPESLPGRGGKGTGTPWARGAGEAGPQGQRGARRQPGGKPPLFSTPQASCLPTESPQPARCARPAPRGTCAQMGFFQHSWFVTNCVTLLRLYLLLSPGRASRSSLRPLVTEPMRERAHRRGLGSPGQTVPANLGDGHPPPLQARDLQVGVWMLLGGHTPAVPPTLSIASG